MIDILMIEDIRKYETKFLGPLTKRQVVCSVIGIILGSIFAIVIPGEFTVKMVFFFIFGLPPALCGFIKFNGMPLEVFFTRFIYLYFLTPPKRKAKHINSFKAELLDIEKKEEQAKTSKMSKKEYKQYVKSKEKHVLYSTKPEYRVYR